MSELSSAKTAAVDDLAAQEGSSPIDGLIVLAKRKKLILVVPVASMVVATIVTLIIPNIYLATVRLLPPQQNRTSAAAMLAQLGGLAGAAAGAAGIKNPNDLYVGMLKSRTVSDHLIDKYDLRKYYDTQYYEVARKKLAEDTSIESGKDGLIEINVQNRDRDQVAVLANAYVHELEGLTKTLAISDASRRRVFLERELEAAKKQLSEAEIKLKTGLVEKGLVSVEADSKAFAETAARLRAQVAAKEMEVQTMGSFITPTNPEFLRANEELKSVRNQLAKFENGAGRSATGARAEGVDAGLANIQALRDVKYQQMVYELLAKQYEAARLNEADDSSIIQVLDAAIKPERRYKPKRSVIAGIAGVLGLLFGIALAFVLEAKEKFLNDPPGRSKWDLLRKYI